MRGQSMHCGGSTGVAEHVLVREQWVVCAHRGVFSDFGALGEYRHGVLHIRNLNKDTYHHTTSKTE